MRNEPALDFHSDFIYIRTPLLPHTELRLIYDTVQGEMMDMDILANQLKAIYADKQLQEAIYLASPVLYDELVKFLQQPGKSTYKGNDRIVLSLFQYYSRLCTRCTPFGLFAGSNLGGWHDHQIVLKIRSRKHINGHLRLDMDFVAGLANFFGSGANKESFRYFSNSSIYKVRDKIRYIEVTNLKEGRKYKISTVTNNALLEEILKKAKTEKSFPDLIEIGLQFGLPIEDIKNYINEIIKAGLLLSNFEPNVTGKEFMFSLLDSLLSNKELHDFGERYGEIISTIKKAGHQPVAYYRDIKNKLAGFKDDINESRLFQVDLVKESAGCFLNDGLKKQIIDTVVAMAKLNTPKSETKLEKFRKLFEERYETKPVPLAIALDPDIGINYESISTGSNSNENIDFFEANSIALYKFNKYNESIKLGGKEIIISDNELGNFTLPKAIPDSFSVMLRLHEEEQATSEPGIEFRYASGPSGAKILGRFCHCDKALFTKVNQYLQLEEQLYPDRIFAEIIHVPEDRIGNVIARPKFRKYEIAFLARPGSAKNTTIYIDDLYLKIQSGHLILYSKRLKKQVVPRLTSAHNFSVNCLQLYHFLCDLQSQSILPGISWNWNFLSNQEFLPRVKYRNILVSPATWNIHPGRLKFLNNLTEESGFPAFKEWVLKLGLPEQVFFAEGDNELLLNLTHPVSMIVLKKEAKKGRSIQLKEAFGTGSETVVKDENDHSYRNEIVVPFYRAPVPARIPVLTNRSSTIAREFPIGGNWVYFKIYTGVSTADTILKEVISPFAESGIERSLFDKWFFIRYYDPQFHLRIRFHSAKIKDRSRIINLLAKTLAPYLESGEVNDFSMHTYRREVERYGSETIEENEKLFFQTSKLVCKLIAGSVANNINGMDFRLGCGLIIVNKMLDEFKMSITEKVNFCLLNRDMFAKEFAVETRKELREQIKNGYRAVTPEIRALLSGDNKNRSIHYQNIFMSLDGNVQEMADSINALFSKLKNKPESDFFGIAASQVHMLVNRLMVSNSRFNEFLIYEYLVRYFQSVIAISAKGAN